MLQVQQRGGKGQDRHHRTPAQQRLQHAQPGEAGNDLPRSQGREVRQKRQWQTDQQERRWIEEGGIADLSAAERCALCRCMRQRVIDRSRPSHECKVRGRPKAFEIRA